MDLIAVYTTGHNLNGDLECIVRAPVGTSLAKIFKLLKPKYGSLRFSESPLQNAEAETLIEMKVCEFEDMMDLGKSLLTNRALERYRHDGY